MLIKMNMIPTFKNIKEFFKNNVSDLHWIRIQAGFSLNSGCVEEYRSLGYYNFETYKNNYIFGNYQPNYNYFILKYTPIPYENFTDWVWDSDDNKVYVPVPLTPRNLKDVVCFFAQNKSKDFHMDLECNLAKAAIEKQHEQESGVKLTSANYGSYGKYLPEVGSIEIRTFSNCDWTFGPSYSMCDYFDAFKQEIGISRNTRGFLTNKLVNYLLARIKVEMRLNPKFLFVHGPHTNFVGELETNPAFVKVV